MLKLIRLNDTATGVPDIVHCAMKPAVHISQGEAYTLSVDGLTNEISYKVPIFVACETHNSIKEGERAAVKCFKVMPGMEFETACHTESLFRIDKGTLVDLCIEEGTTVVQKAVEGGQFIVSDLMCSYNDYIIRVKAI